MKTRLSRFSRDLWLTAALLFSLALAFALYAVLEDQVDRANTQRHLSMSLAHELRLSSEELTRMARTYVVTAEPIYKQNYQDILDIRNGKKPRPANLENSGERIPLLEIMRLSGFTDAEFQILETAKANSDRLTAIEFEAMRLAELDDGQLEVHRAKARELMHDAQYHQYKAGIMQPIATIFQMVETRTRDAVHQAQKRAAILRLVSALLGFGLVAMILRANNSLVSTLGGSVDTLYAHMSRIGQGNFSTPIDLENTSERSVLGQLAITQANLNELDAKRKDAQSAQDSALRESETLMQALDKHSIVSITDAAGKIIYANKMFSQISGYSKAELIGVNHRIVKSTNQPEGYWAAMWKTISAGYVWRDVVCNRAKDGSPYWVDTVIAPFFDESGGIEKYISIRSDLSSIKAAQNTLEHQHSRLSNIIESTQAGTWEWNIQTHESSINARWAEMLGYTLEEVGSNSATFWEQHTHPDDLAEAAARLKKHLAGELPTYEYEARLRHKDGRTLWLLTRGKLMSRTEDGSPAWIFGINLDITSSKQSELLLQKSAEELRGHAAFLARAGRIAGVGRWQMDLVDSAIEWSDQTCHIHDVAPGHKPTFEEALHYFAPEVRGEIQSAFDAATHTGKPWDLELPLITAMGREIWVRSAAEAEYQDGKRIRLVGIFQDITQRHKLEVDIRTRNALMQAILSNLPVGISVMDKNLNLVEANTLFRTLLDLPSSLFSHGTTRFENIIRFNAERGEYGAGDPAAIVAGVVERARKGEAHQFERRRQDGTTLQVRGAPMPDGGFVTTYTDITELINATEAAQEASRSKSQFVANMSHEIRTPMNAILGMLKLLQNAELTVRQQDYASKAEGAAKSLLGLLNDILDFSKVEAGKMELDLEPFRLDRLLRDLSVILSANVGAKPVEVLFDIDPATPKVWVGDAMRLQQILINLGGNAIKFTAEGNVVIQIQVKEKTDTHATLRVCVRDSGIGIAPENQLHIFDGFSQAEASTTRRFGGTGLGLSICKRMVALMGGELAVESELNVGSAFFFTITVPTSPLLEEPSEAPVERLLEPMDVLVVDDNAVARELMVSMAKSWGWQVDAAASGMQALALVQARSAAAQPPYQTMFIDWHMPEMDGWETITRLRELAPDSKPPITVMVTAHGRETLAQRKAQDQAMLNAFLVKPITASMLYDVVADARAGFSNLRARPRSQSSSAGRLEGMRLLIVEDNLINQQVAQELLEAEGAVVQIADNGQLGLDALATASVPFDAVLMDLQMPVMDGYQATETIRTTMGLTQLPIIAMTANAMASDREACLAVGMNDHVGKPFDLPHLIDVLLHHTRRIKVGVLSKLQTKVARSETRAVDAEGALSRLGGNAALYGRILRSYLSDITKLPGQLDALLAANNTDEAVRLFHTLKGLSATVGAHALSEEAKALESALKAAQPDGPIGLDIGPRLKAAVAQVLQDMAPIAAKFASVETQDEPPRSAEAPEDVLRLRADLATLRELLASSDMQALEVYARVQANRAASHTELSGPLKALGDAMAAFDFARAVQACDALLLSN